MPASTSSTRPGGKEPLPKEVTTLKDYLEYRSKFTESRLDPIDKKLDELTRDKSASAFAQQLTRDKNEKAAAEDPYKALSTRGVRVLGPLDHGFCQSIYFGGPENLVLEVSTSPAAIDAEAWIDPEVVALNGISAEELERFKNPPAYVNTSDDPVPQPPAGSGRPEYTRMSEGFAAAFDLPDEVVTRELSENTPPVQVASAG